MVCNGNVKPFPIVETINNGRDSPVEETVLVGERRSFKRLTICLGRNSSHIDKAIVSLAEAKSIVDKVPSSDPMRANSRFLACWTAKSIPKY
jgi:hypothetical protein